MDLIATDKFWGSNVLFVGFQGFSQTIFWRFLFTTSNGSMDSIKGTVFSNFYSCFWCLLVLHYLDWKRRCDWSLHSRDIDIQRVGKVIPFVLSSIARLQRTHFPNSSNVNISGMKRSITLLFSVQLISNLGAFDTPIRNLSSFIYI